MDNRAMDGAPVAVRLTDRQADAAVGGRTSPPRRSGPTGGAKDSPIGPIPRHWSVVTLRALSHRAGRYGSPAAASEYRPDLPRYVRISDISSDGRLRHTNRASIAWHQADGFRLRPGDLLFARSGVTCGKTYLYDPRDGDCAHAGYLICFSLDTERCEPDFVARWTQSSFYRAWLIRTQRQAAQPNINAAEFGSLPVPLPPRSEQRRVTAALAALDRLVATHTALVSKLARTRLALLGALFRRGVTASGALGSGQPRVATSLGPLPRRFDIAAVE
ncbi:MAG: restriction endonuclease subunit S, partial [Myxococcota bacterium]